MGKFAIFSASALAVLLPVAGAMAESQDLANIIFACCLFAGYLFQNALFTEPPR